MTDTTGTVDQPDEPDAVVVGTGSPSVLSNMPVSIEQHVEWTSGCIADLDERGVATIEVTEDAEVACGRHVAEVARTTLFVLAGSRYLGADVPGEAPVSMPHGGGVARGTAGRSVAA